MGQQEILKLLKDNGNTKISAKDISGILKQNIQSVTSSLNKLVMKEKEVKVCELKSDKSNGHYVRLYSFMKRDAYLKQVENDLQSLKDENSYRTSTDCLLMITCKELKEIKEILKNGTKSKL